MKNLELNENIKRILKGCSTILITSAIALSTSACKSDKKEENNISNNESITQTNKTNNNCIDCEYDTKLTKDSIRVSSAPTLKPTSTPKPTATPKPKKQLANLDTLYFKNDKPTLIKDTSDIDLSDYTSISEPFTMPYCNVNNNEDNENNVREITKNNKKYLVDANDINHILIANYDKLNKEVKRFQYYDALNGGVDTGLGAGMVYKITNNNIDYIIDASDYTKILLVDCNSIGTPYYLSNYDYVNGGYDTGISAGWVQEIEKNNKKYLVDANSYEQILASGYSRIYCDSEDNVIVEYEDGRKDIIKNNKDLVPEKSDVLTR